MFETMVRSSGLSRRGLLQLGGGLTAAGLLAGCGSDGGSSSSGTLDLWMEPNATTEEMNKFFARIRSGFVKASPDYDVKGLIVPWGDAATKMSAAFAGNSPPDVSYQIHRWLNLFRNTGVLADMNKLAGSDISKLTDGIPQNFLDSAAGPDGELLAVPYVAAYFCLVLNEDVWERAGSPTLPTTYEEMIPFAQAMTFDTQGRVLGSDGFDKENIDVYGMCWAPAPVQINYIWNYFWSYGSDYVSEDLKDVGFDNDEGRAAMQVIKDMLDSGAATPPTLYADESKWYGAITTGKVGMQWFENLYPDQIAANPDLRLKVITPPAGPAGQSVTGQCGYIAVSEKSKNKSGAFELANYMLSEKPRDDYILTTFQKPVHPASSDYYAAVPDEKVRAYQTEAVATTSQYARLTHNLQYDPEEVLISKINDFLLGRQDMDSVIEQCSDQVQQLASQAS